MDEIAQSRNLHKENSSQIPAHWVYKSINPVFKLLLASQIALNNCKWAELELFHYNLHLCVCCYIMYILKAVQLSSDRSALFMCVLLYYVYIESCSAFIWQICPVKTLKVNSLQIFIDLQNLLLSYFRCNMYLICSLHLNIKRQSYFCYKLRS